MSGKGILLICFTLLLLVGLFAFSLAFTICSVYRQGTEQTWFTQGL